MSDSDLRIELKWVLTEYGKNRITEILTNPAQKIVIDHLEFGADGTGVPSDREGLYPSEGNGKLFDYKGESPIYEMGRAEDRENTVYFKAVIGEKDMNCEIRELALFEKVDITAANPTGKKMFAVGVGAPIVKPDMSLGYVISVDYTLFIESTNLMEVYDNVILNENNEFVQKEDIEGLNKTLLFVESNLVDQIEHNTHILGLDRAQQLEELIEDTQLKYNTTSLTNYYTNLSNLIGSNNDLMGFWSFNYTDIYGTQNVIKDFSPKTYNLSTNKVIGGYPQEYLGVVSALDFSEGDYFYLPAISTCTTSSKNIELGNLIDHDSVDTFIWNDLSSNWVSNSNSAATYTQAQLKAQKIMYYLKADEGYAVDKDKVQYYCWEHTDTSVTPNVKTKCYTTKVAPTTNDYVYYGSPVMVKKEKITSVAEGSINFGSGDFNRLTTGDKLDYMVSSSLTLNKFAYEKKWTYEVYRVESKDAYRWYYMDGGEKVTLSPESFKISILEYTGVPEDGDTITINKGIPTIVSDTIALDHEVTQVFAHTWKYDNAKGVDVWRMIDADGKNMGVELNSGVFKNTIIDYTGTAKTGDIIILHSSDSITPSSSSVINLTGKQFDLLNEVQNNDAPFAFMACLKHNKENARHTLLAQLDAFNNKYGFEIAKTEQNAIEITLYTDNDEYYRVHTSANTVPKTLYTLLIMYNGNKLDPQFKIYINGASYTAIQDTSGGTYKGMSNVKLKTTSYILDANGDMVNFIDSKIGIISLIKGKTTGFLFTEEQVRCNNMILNSLCGKNVYYRV